jgi:hypothetical protein
MLMIMFADARRKSLQPAVTAGAKRVRARTYNAARGADGLGTVTEDGWDLHPVRPQAAAHFPQWQFDWGSGSTPVGREWLAWALHERLGLDRANPRHAGAFHRLVTYLGGLSAAGWTRTLEEFRAVARWPVPPTERDVSRGVVAAAARDERAVALNSRRVPRVTAG